MPRGQIDVEKKKKDSPQIDMCKEVPPTKSQSGVSLAGHQMPAPCARKERLRQTAVTSRHKAGKQRTTIGINYLGSMLTGKEYDVQVLHLNHTVYFT
jgi:hypothetical protein